MRRRLFAITALSALLALQLGVACLAVTRMHAAMPMDDGPCETGATAEQKLLCATPGALATLASHAPEPLETALDVLPATPLSPVADVPSLPEAREHGPPDPPPAFLLHRALLI